MNDFLYGYGPRLPDSGGAGYDPFGAGNTYAMGYKTRKQARRTAQPVLAALAAARASFAPQLDYDRAHTAAYGDLFREESARNLDWASGAMQRFNPESLALLRLLTQDASALASPNYANPYEDRMAQQNIRAAQSARGMGYGNSDALAEILGLDRNTEARRIQRGSYGAGIAGLGQNYYNSTLASILGGGATGSNAAPPDVITPDEHLSVNLNDIMQRRNMQQARKARQNSLWGAGISAIGSLAGGLLGGGILGGGGGGGIGPGGGYYSDPNAMASLPRY